ncbi:disulfide oxidoreductase [Caldibacillus lycopersici]|uniref:Probable disulfide formation protein n=1 Tax=Perspicuibacillus lycopersici TaxID=1325689 RepID=A0AAE3IQ70_9BACI|nr:disulfide oxidoreductase [Perspicuibacillus lycopersici]MCU9612560.1 disulfide oxidoreductase [Perspicuibacillus lycopersici]
MSANKKLDNLFFLSWVTSIIAMFGSLYFSEIRQYIPCELCWYQRILMYPMTILLGIAYVRKDWHMSLYAMILSAAGGIISIYHYSIQKITVLGDSTGFCGQVPCTAQYINWFGFITIPFLALLAFLIIFIISLLIWKQLKEAK